MKKILFKAVLALTALSWILGASVLASENNPLEEENAQKSNIPSLPCLCGNALFRQIERDVQEGNFDLLLRCRNVDPEISVLPTLQNYIFPPLYLLRLNSNLNLIFYMNGIKSEDPMLVKYLLKTFNYTPWLSQSPFIKTLDFSRPFDLETDWGNLEYINIRDLQPFTHVTKLNLSCNKVDCPNVYLLSQMSQLTDLNLARSLQCEHESHCDMLALTGLSNLITLSVSNNDLFGSQLGVFFKLTTLTDLDMHFSMPNDYEMRAGYSFFSTLGNMTNLTNLNLGGVGLDNSEPYWAQLTNLTRLDLNRNSLGGDGSQFNNLKSLTKLQDLIIGGNFLNDLCIPTLLTLTNLTSLDIECNTIMNVGAFSQLTKLKKLSVLLSDFHNDVQNFGGLTNLTNLTNLEISYINEQEVAWLQWFINRNFQPLITNGVKIDLLPH